MSSVSAGSKSQDLTPDFDFRKPERDGSHDFDFQTGQWRIRNERLVERLAGCTEWETFESTNRAWLLPGGLGNMDEYATDHWPGFVGLSLRLYNRETRQWSIYWASNQKGTLDPPVVGSFANGVGVFEGRDELDGRPIDTLSRIARICIKKIVGGFSG